MIAGSDKGGEQRQPDRSSLPMSVWQRREVFLQGKETKRIFPGEEKSTRGIQDHTGKSDVREKKKKIGSKSTQKNTLSPKKAPKVGWDPFQEVAVKLSNFVTNQERTQDMMREL